MKRLILALAPLLLVACDPTGGLPPRPDLSSNNQHPQDLSSENESPDLLPSTSPDLNAQPDVDLAVAPSVDLASPNDLTGADLTGVPLVDLATHDQTTTTPSDLLAPNDLKPPLDLAGVPTTAWNAACTSGSVCATPTGESGGCETAFGQPVCVHTCDLQDDYSLCEGGSGLCLPLGDGSKLCLPKCGDATNTTCVAGSSCAFLGYRQVAGSNPAVFNRVGACLPDCTPTGADACKGANTTCNVVQRSCAQNGCPGGCPTNSTCVGATCTPSAPKNLYDTCSTNATNVATGCLGDTCFAGTSTPGFCSLFCNSETGDATCGAGGVCWTDNNTPGDGTASGGTTLFPSGSFSITGGRTSGACVKACDDSSQCPAGFFCGEFNGKRGCLVGTLTRGVSPPAGTGLPGVLCRANADCASAACLLLPGFADGICQKATAASCPAGTIAGAGNVCFQLCDATMDSVCAGSLTCALVTATQTACVPNTCRDSADCSTGFTCDSKSGECRNTPAGAKAVGTACTADTDCSGDYCIVQRPTVPLFSSGYCSASCTILPDLSDTCPSGAICSATAIGANGSCFRLCDAPGAVISKFGACRTAESYVCKPFTGDPRFGFCASN